MIHSNDEPRLRQMLKIPNEHKIPAVLVAIYDDCTEKKRLGHSTGSFTTMELVQFAREYERANGGPWTPPPPAKVEEMKSERGIKPQLVKA